MVREIIHAQVGQCGNQIGNAFWLTMQSEHHLAENGKFKPLQPPGTNKEMSEKEKEKNDYQITDKIGVYFRDAGDRRYVPRAALVDLEPGTLDVIRESAIGPMFKPDNFVFGASGAGNNWAKGHYTEGAELIEDVLTVLRKEAENADCVQGFQFTHSLGGGTGSGLGTLLLTKIRDAYAEKITATFSVYPSPKVSDVVVEPYNAILSIHQLLENSDETFVVDNEALFNISHNILEQKAPTYKQLNWVISLVMAGITASLRFPGKLNGDLRKMGVNLIPFPRLHFFLIAQSPLFAAGKSSKVKLTVKEVTDQMWDGTRFLANVKSEDGKYMTASCNYRGNLATQEVDKEVNDVQTKHADEFVKWIPNNIKSSVIVVPPEDTAMSGTFVANTTAMASVFKRITSQFARMYKRKAFLHWYTGEGMDTMEFEEADKNVRDLITEYQDKQDAVADLEADDDNEADGDEDGDEDGGDEDGDEDGDF